MGTICVFRKFKKLHLKIFFYFFALLSQKVKKSCDSFLENIPNTVSVAIITFFFFSKYQFLTFFIGVIRAPFVNKQMSVTLNVVVK